MVAVGWLKLSDISFLDVYLYIYMDGCVLCDHFRYMIIF